MSEMQGYEYEVGTNPYGIAPTQGVSLADGQRHDMGNAVAASTEARVVAEVKAQVLVARQFPRDPRVSVDRILRECERPTLAEKATYLFPRGNENVSGPSIRLAEVMARNWGNCTFGLEVIERKIVRGGVGMSVLRAYAWDLESNTYIARQFEVKHWRSTKKGGYALNDDRDIYELEANVGSRRMRACILQMIPGDVTQVALDKCRVTLRSGLVAQMSGSERNVLIKRTIEVFAKIGIQEKDLIGYLNGVPTTEWTADHMIKLKELKFSLDDGAVTIAEVFPKLAGGAQNELISDEQIEAIMKFMKETGRQGDIQQELKKMGIAKVADIPAYRLAEVQAMMEGFKKAPSPAPDQGAGKVSSKAVQTRIDGN